LKKEGDEACAFTENAALACPLLVTCTDTLPGAVDRHAHPVE
jgi:hypothetical protein